MRYRRSAVMTAGALEDIDPGFRFVVEVSGLDYFEMENIEVDGTIIDSLEAWNATSWPSAGSVILNGLCATDLANEAYGWEDILAWHRGSDQRSMSIILVDGDDSENARLTLYDASVLQVDSCTGYNQSATVQAPVLEQG